jgi:hypothetical protein
VITRPPNDETGIPNGVERVKVPVPEFRSRWLTPPLRIVYVVDPSGVLWHVAQRRAGVAHDS